MLASGVLLIVSLLSFIDDSLEPAEWLALCAVAFGIPGVFLRAIVSIRNWMLDINVLMVIAVAGESFSSVRRPRVSICAFFSCVLLCHGIVLVDSHCTEKQSSMTKHVSL